MYTLLVDTLAFETKNLKDTYSNIRKCDYHMPTNLRKTAADMIIAMFQSDLSKRSSITKLLHDVYFKIGGYIPNCLPASAWSLYHLDAERKHLIRMNGVPMDESRYESSFLKNNLHDAITAQLVRTTLQIDCYQGA